jgi:hypothetical protein
VRLLREAGVVLRPRRWRRVDPEAIVALYGQGLSMRAVASQLGVSFPTVRAAVSEAGVARPPGGQVDPVDVATLAQDYEAGQSLTALAAQTGMSTAWVADRLHEAGVAVRRPGRPPCQRRGDGGEPGGVDSSGPPR